MPLSPLVGDRTAIASPWVSATGRPPSVTATFGAAAYQNIGFAADTCQVECRADPDCPPGWVCANLDNDSSGGDKFCQQPTCQTGPSEDAPAEAQEKAPNHSLEMGTAKATDRPTAAEQEARASFPLRRLGL